MFGLREMAWPQAFASFLAGSVWVIADDFLSIGKALKKLT